MWIPSEDPGADVRVEPQPYTFFNPQTQSIQTAPAAEYRNQPAPLVYTDAENQPAANMQILLRNDFQPGSTLRVGVFNSVSNNCNSDDWIGYSSTPDVTVNGPYEGIPWAQNNNDPDVDNDNTVYVYDPEAPIPPSAADRIGVAIDQPEADVVPLNVTVSLESSAGCVNVDGNQVSDIVNIRINSTSSGDSDLWHVITLSGIEYDVALDTVLGPVRNGVFARQGGEPVPSAYSWNNDPNPGNLFSEANGWSMVQWTNTAYISGFRFLSSGVGQTVVDGSTQYITTITLQEVNAGDGLPNGWYGFTFGQWHPLLNIIAIPSVRNLQLLPSQVAANPNINDWDGYNPEDPFIGMGQPCQFPTGTGPNCNNGLEVEIINLNPGVVESVSFDVYGQVVFPGLITANLDYWPNQGDYVADDQQLAGQPQVGLATWDNIENGNGTGPGSWTGNYVPWQTPLGQNLCVTGTEGVFEDINIWWYIENPDPMGDPIPVGFDGEPIDPANQFNPAIHGNTEVEVLVDADAVWGINRYSVDNDTYEDVNDLLNLLQQMQVTGVVLEDQPCAIFFWLGEITPENGDPFSVDEPGDLGDFDALPSAEDIIDYYNDEVVGSGYDCEALDDLATDLGGPATIDDLEAVIAALDECGFLFYGVVTSDVLPAVRNCGLFDAEPGVGPPTWTITADPATQWWLSNSCFSDVNDFVFPPVAVAYSNALPDRIGGQNRHETAAQIGFNVSPCAHTAVLVNGWAYPDALSASYLAGALKEIFVISSFLSQGLLEFSETPDVPILTTTGNSLHEAARIALVEMGVQRVYIVGGTAVVSQEVEDTLKAQTRTNCGGTSYLPHAQTLDVRRVAGENRYVTNARVIQRVQSVFADAGPVGFARYNDRIRAQLTLGSPSKRTAIIATGEAFPDALSAGPLSYTNFPLVLTTSNGIHPSAASTLNAIGIEQVIIMGQTAAISQATEDALRATPLIGDDVIRIGGDTRYETNVAFLDFLRTWDSSYGIEPPAVTAELDYDYGMDWPYCWSQFGPYPWWSYFADNWGGSGVYGTLAFGVDIGFGAFENAFGGYGDTVFLARGDDFADALASAPLVGAGCGSLLLTTTDQLHPTAAAWIFANGPLLAGNIPIEVGDRTLNNVIALGLAEAVSNATLAQANEALFPPVGP